ncbi:hypothetical protein [Aequorivita echinoideorum]|uniref:Uncharacterized protein n=1 Tax=Aequorivita echinoideorum TaxID=1549647 RepID=A0ABS5S6F3_9FLAO|nr:hypothetical protein [Aequorivita echinoideorum]MBT0607962.1 hypothetical protein [Aequorivita echinoideorum]
MARKITPLIFLLFCAFGFSQVGIGTETPRAALDVHGSMLVQQGFNLGTLPTVKNTDEDFKLLTRLTNSSPVGEITVLDVDSLTVAPINVINYRFNNVSLDNLTNVNLQYDANKYVVAVSNFQYLGDAIPKTASGTTTSIGAFLVRAFVENGTWHLEIKNRFLDLQASAPNGIRYRATLIIYDKSYFRNLPVITTNLGGSNTGMASAVPTL